MCDLFFALARSPLFFLNVPSLLHTHHVRARTGSYRYKVSFGFKCNYPSTFLFCFFASLLPFSFFSSLILHFARHHHHFTLILTPTRVQRAHGIIIDSTSDTNNGRNILFSPPQQHTSKYLPRHFPHTPLDFLSTSCHRHGVRRQDPHRWVTSEGPALFLRVTHHSHTSSLTTSCSWTMLCCAQQAGHGKPSHFPASLCRQTQNCCTGAVYHPMNGRRLLPSIPSISPYFALTIHTLTLHCTLAHGVIPRRCSTQVHWRPSLVRSLIPFPSSIPYTNHSILQYPELYSGLRHPRLVLCHQVTFLMKKKKKWAKAQ